MGRIRLTHKCYVRLEKLAIDENWSLSSCSVGDNIKRFITQTNKNLGIQDVENETFFCFLFSGLDSLGPIQEKLQVHAADDTYQRYI